ncbi:MAG: hypothetical protein HKN97_12405 [Myxococcales bacterium]|nr:hypothetical protein [Myxococcales bacterium]NNK43754.1 hypothetical protein [Myxococcales bacterium]
MMASLVRHHQQGEHHAQITRDCGTLAIEEQGLSIFGQSLEYYGALQSKGAIESFEPVIFNPTGGDLNGIILIRGSLDQLDALKREDRFIDLMMRAAHSCEGLGVNDAYLEGELQNRTGRCTQIINQ